MIKVNKAIKCRLYPNNEQKIMLAKTFGCCRKVYNLMLNDKINYYEKNNKMLNNTPAQYKADYPYLKEIDSLALANVQLNLERAYKNFFRDKKIGFPKYKSAKNKRQSYTTNLVANNIRIENNKIKLPKIGFVKLKLHKKPDTSWKLKSATVSKEGNGNYYVSVLYEFDKINNNVTLNKALGLDYASNGLYVDSEGNTADMPKFYKKTQNRLAEAQRKLRHKILKSNNYYKEQVKIAKIYNKIKNQRKDFLHKESTKIANLYDVVCVETLEMKAIGSKKKHIAKETTDNSYCMFLTMLEYKLEDRGKKLIKVDKYYPSSQLCSNCGYQNTLTKDLHIRHWICPKCGASHNRDINAAINIKNEGLRLLRL